LDAYQVIGETKAIAIIRKVPESHILDTVKALNAGGIRCLEVTMDSPNALKMIEKIKSTYGDELVVGAGTVLDPETARHVILAGADFVLSPTLDTQVIEISNRYGTLAVPGVLTPTEALTALSAGARLIKVFPVSTLGPQYIKDVLGPLNQLSLLPVGGVDAENAKAYLQVGAYAVGVGSRIVDAADIMNGNFDALKQKAETLIKGIS